MAVTSQTPSVTFTANGSTTNFAFNFVVPATDTTGTITDATADMSLSSAVLTVDTAGLFYTSDLQGKAITVTGAGASSTDLTTTILSVDSATQLTLNASASTQVTNTTISITTGTYNTTLRNNTDIQVYVDGTLKTITTDYTVRLNLGDDANKSGTVIFNSAPANGATVVIIRDVTLQRTTDFQAGGALTAKALNGQFDEMIMAVQDTQNSADKLTIKFPPDEVGSGISTTLPSITNRANKFFAFDGSGAIDIVEDFTNTETDFNIKSVTATTGTLTNATITTGTVTNFISSNVDINGGTIDGTTINATSLTSSNVDINGGTIDGTTIGATTPANATFNIVNTGNINASGGQLEDGVKIGTDANPLSVFYADDVTIRGGYIDDTILGFGTPASATFTNVIIQGTLTYSGGSLVLSSIQATGANGVTTQTLRGYLNNDLAITGNANVTLTAGGGVNEYVVLDDKVSFSTDNSSITVGARTYTGKLIQSPNSDIVIDAYKGGSAGKLNVVSSDGIHIDGLDPKVVGQLQLKLEDGDTANQIFLTNSADADTAGIQLNRNSDSTLKLGQLYFAPDFNTGAGGIGWNKQLVTQYRKSIVWANSGASFTYPSAAVGDKISMAGQSEDYGYVVLAVTGGTGTSVTYEVLTSKQTWTSTDLVRTDSLGQTSLITAGSISTQNNSSDFYIGYRDAAIDTDDLPEGSTNLYFTDARFTTKIGQTSIDALSDVTTSGVADGQVLAYNSSSNIFQPSTVITNVNGQTGPSVTLTTSEVSEGTRLYYTDTRFDTRLATKTTNDITEGTDLYFTNERVDDRVNDLLIAGTGISLAYDDSLNTLTITNTATGLLNIVEDTSPQLGGGLDVNGNNIFSLSNADIKIQPNGTGAVLVGADNTNAEISTNGTGDLLLRTNGSTTTAAANSSQIKIEDGTDGDIYITPHGDGQIDLDSYVWPKNGLGGVDQVLKINTIAGGVAQLAWTTAGTGSMSNLVEDTTPQLGGDLDVNGNDIISTQGSSIQIDNNITLAPFSGNDTRIQSNVLTLGQTNINTRITTNGTGDLTLDTNDGTNSGSIVIPDGVNQNISITPNGTGQLNLKNVKVDNNGGINVQANGYGNIIVAGRDGTDIKSYSLEVQSHAGATGLVGGNPAGSFGLAGYADSGNGAGSSTYAYLGNVVGVLGDASGGLDSSFTGDSNHGIRMGVFKNGITDFSTWYNAATFRSTNADFMQEKLKFDYSSNTVTIEVPTANDDLLLKTNGTGELRVDADVVEQYSTKGILLHDQAQGGYTDLTGDGATAGALFGAGIVAEETNGAPNVTLFSHKSNGALQYPNLWAHRSRDDGAGNKDFLDSGDVLFSFFGAAYDGGGGGGEGTYRKTCSVEYQASEDHSATDGGGKIVFFTTENGTQSYTGTARLTIDDDIQAHTAIRLDEVSAPTNVTDKGFIYAKDVSGTAEVFVMDAAGNETQISPHNEAGEWQYFSKNVKTGKTVRINMEQMIRDIEQLTGKKYIENE